MSTRGWEEGRGDGRKTGTASAYMGPSCVFQFASPGSERGGGESEKVIPPPPPQVARSDNVDKNMAFIWTRPWCRDAAWVWSGVAWQATWVWRGRATCGSSSHLPSEIILFVHFNVESARFGSVRPTRFRHGEGGPRTRHARTFTSTSTSTSTPTPTPTSTRIHTLRPGPHPTPPCTYRIPRHSHRSKPSLPYLFGERERAPGPPPSLPPLPPGTASSLRPNVCC